MDKKKVVKTDAEWREQLTGEQYRVTRKHGTERAFTGEYWNTKEKGVYECIGCGEELFSSETKYDSGTGWPSFWQPLNPELIQEKTEFGSSVKLIYMRGMAEKHKLLNAFEPLQVPWFNVGSNPEYVACLKQLPDHLRAKLPTIKALAPSPAVHRELSTGFVYAGSVQHPLSTLSTALDNLDWSELDHHEDDQVVDLLQSRRDRPTDNPPLISYSTPQHSAQPLVLGCPIAGNRLDYSILVPFESLLTTDQSQTPEVHPVGSISPSGAYALLYPY